MNLEHLPDVAFNIGRDIDGKPVCRVQRTVINRRITSGQKHGVNIGLMVQMLAGLITYILLASIATVKKAYRKVYIFIT